MKDKIVQQVVDKFQQRSERGISKYETTLEQNNKDNYLLHLQEELQDATLYLEKLISLKQEITMLVNTYPNDYELGRAVREFVK